MTSPLSIRDLSRLALVLAAATLVWLTHGGYWSAATWQRPASYNVDALETLTRFQIAAEEGARFPLHPVVERLGAPWHADWSSYPMPDAPWYWAVGQLSRKIGLIPASHVALGAAHLLAVAAMFGVARLLGQRPLGASAVALLFGFAHAISYRGLSHHSFMLAYIVPLTLAVAALVARSRILVRRRRWQAAGLLASAAVGAGNPYFIFMTLQLYGFGLLWQLIRGRRRVNILMGVACIAVCGGTFVAMNLPALRAVAAAEEGHAFRRNPAEANIYGLRPLELVTPPPRHAWPWAARYAEESVRTRPVAGERYSGYLGLAGVAGLLVAFGSGVRSLRRQGPGRFRPGYATVALWILAFAVVGGINSWLARAGFDVFRAGNRYSVHLAALALLALGAWAHRRRRRGLLAAGIVAATLIGLRDQLPRTLPPEAARDIAALVESDRRAAAVLRDELPAGTAVFQLPAPPFPEAGTFGTMGDYEHFRPFLHAPHLRFSYGSMRNTGEARWAAHTAILPAGLLIESLEAAGFGALWVDRRAYPNHAGDLLATLRATSVEPIPLDGRDHIALFRLRPAPRATAPDPSEVRWHEVWDPTTPASALSVHTMRGWHPLEIEGGRRWRWAAGRATLGVWNASPHPMTVILRLKASSLSPGALTVGHGDTVLGTTTVGNEPRDVAGISLQVPAGSSEIWFAFDGPLVRPSGESRQLGFAVHDLTLKPR